MPEVSLMGLLWTALEETSHVCLVKYLYALRRQQFFQGFFSFLYVSFIHILADTLGKCTSILLKKGQS
jgi:hypothetical protein